MKNILLTICLMLSLGTFAQQLDTIVQTANTKDQVFANALQFISGQFENSDAVIDVNDEGKGMLIFKPILGTSYSDSIMFRSKGVDRYQRTIKSVKAKFDAQLYVKEGKFRLIITNIEYNDMFDLGIKSYAPYTFPAHPTSAEIITLKLINRFQNDLIQALTKKAMTDF